MAVKSVFKKEKRKIFKVKNKKQMPVINSTIGYSFGILFLHLEHLPFK